jgi:hypothetical protein
MAKRQWVPPWFPVTPGVADAAAIQAITRGEATPDQQTRAMEFIVRVICDATTMSYSPESHSDTDFAEGKRFVSLQIVRICSMSLSQLRKDNAQ